MATLTQLKTELSSHHWFVTPDFGCSLDNFETSRRVELELRPEVEFSYVFAKENYQIIDMRDKLVGSQVFVKLGYDYTEIFSEAAASQFKMSAFPPGSIGIFRSGGNRIEKG